MDEKKTGIVALFSGVIRGVTLALGAFALVSLGASWVYRGVGDANIWWIDASVLPWWVEDPLIAVGGVCLILWAIRPRAGILLRRPVTVLSIAALLAIVLRNAAVFYQLWWHGVIRSAAPLPVSALVALLLIIVLWKAAWPADQPGATSMRLLGIILGLAAFVVLFPLAQILLYGNTDYRRRADAIVVLGAKVDEDGNPSRPLADRVRTGVELYQQKLAPLMIMSGGPGDGTTHETVAMQKLAMQLGVPARAIVRDEQGLNTASTMHNVASLAGTRGVHSVLAVSHSWHLPRIKLAAGGGPVAVYTVPCTESRPLTATPLYMAREIVAFWKYYLTDVLGR